MGTLWNRSGLVERHADDLRASGAKAYFYEGGTTTPLTVYRNAAQTSAHPHPVVADANGRWPDVFVPFITSYDVRVTDAAGVQLTFSLEIPNPDPVVAPPPDILPEQLVRTGMTHLEFVNTTKIGYVRLNGETIGNGASGGTERANDDTEALFTYLWSNLLDTIAPVSGGRGASAENDFASSKTIQLPDLRGAVPVGLDDMGNVAGGFFPGLTFGVGNATTAGSTTGLNVQTQVPSHTHTGTIGNESAHVHSGATGVQIGDHVHPGTTLGASGNHVHSLTGLNTGGVSQQHTHSFTADLGNTPTAVSAAGGTIGATTAAAANTSVESVDHTHSLSGNTGAESADHTHNFTSGIQNADHTHNFTSGGGTAHSHSLTVNSFGGTTNNLPRSVLVTWYIKL